MESVINILLAVHIAAGSVAVLAGAVPIVTTKGGILHRSFGGWFRRAMYAVIGTAAVMTLIAMKPYFAALTTAAAIASFSGMRVLKRKRPDLDDRQRAKSADWIVTVAAFLMCCYLVLATSAGEFGNNATVFYALIGGAGTYAVYDLLRFTFPTAWPFFPRLWFYEHLVKMLGAYSAVVAAFSGSVLHFLPIPEPWKQLWPTILFHNLIILFVIWYVWKGKRRARV